MKVIGELVKNQGHIRFPFSLDISWLIKNGAGLNNWGENLPNGHSNILANQLNMELGRRKINQKYRQMGKSVLPEDVVQEELDKRHWTFIREESSFPSIEGCSNIIISKSEVCSVSEKDALAAEASVLFHEKI
ncbi:hypothetical protein RJ639_005449 [Escallonia herrerae]|uniref:Uncharacterized protein n=1 Tax=Escallonia herrerae TaxID=1293975 RepID=A0AA88VXZ0_9ASTE|nr:hypothetical protein RJ639_005449 [Escallonia herrerae]